MLFSFGLMISEKLKSIKNLPKILQQMYIKEIASGCVDKYIKTAKEYDFVGKINDILEKTK